MIFAAPLMPSSPTFFREQSSAWKEQASFQQFHGKETLSKRLDDNWVSDCSRNSGSAVLCAIHDFESAYRTFAMAIDLAETRKAQLHVVCVADTLHAPLFMSEVDDVMGKAMSEAQSVLAEAAAWAQTRNIAIRGHALTGSPTRAIAALASAVDAQLLVIGRSKRSSLSRRLFGSAADGILSMARCPVVVAG